jgi:selenocysteine lyase/cysteine desulfurase
VRAILIWQIRTVVRIYGPITAEGRGGTIAFNFYDPVGTVFDCYAVQEEANQCGLSLRSGCFCNPGVREVALGFVREEVAACFRNKARMTYEQFLDAIDNQKQGAVRVSVGLATNFADVYQFVQFVRTFIDREGPLADKTVQPQQLQIPMNSECVCGYHDHRTRKMFCPRC